MGSFDDLRPDFYPYAPHLWNIAVGGAEPKQLYTYLLAIVYRSLWVLYILVTGCVLFKYDLLKA